MQLVSNLQWGSFGGLLHNNFIASDCVASIVRWLLKEELERIYKEVVVPSRGIVPAFNFSDWVKPRIPSQEIRYSVLNIPTGEK
jgi:hypothetical protein